MKVLLLSDGIFPYSLGGMQKHSYYLAKYLAQNQVDIHLAHCVYGDQILPSNLEVANIFGIPEENVFGLNFPSGISFPAHYIFKSYQYSKLLWRFYQNRLSEFDLIYAQGFTGLYFTENKEKIPVIVNMHGVEMFQKGFTVKEKIEKKLLQIPAKSVVKKADKVQSLGGKLNQLLAQISDSKKVWQCGIGIDENWIQANSPKQANSVYRFVFVGRNEFRKGLHILYPVLQELEKRYSFKVDFIGPIEKEQQETNGNYIYHGRITEETKIQTIIDQCDCLLVPSLSEGMPTVILEAMGRGLAIVASDVGAVSELVCPRNGYLCEPGNKESLQKAILSILQSPPHILQNLKIQSISKSHAFTWPVVIQKYIQGFKSCTKS
jgi:glycosyltransferase involved in cell wall biosynthesis